jgi:hypothetical protein
LEEEEKREQEQHLEEEKAEEQVESLLMDADNRVVLNCGGIRHEAYKVNIQLSKS